MYAFDSIHQLRVANFNTSTSVDVRAVVMLWLVICVGCVQHAGCCSSNNRCFSKSFEFFFTQQGVNPINNLRRVNPIRYWCSRHSTCHVLLKQHEWLSGYGHVFRNNAMLTCQHARVLICSSCGFVGLLVGHVASAIYYRPRFFGACCALHTCYISCCRRCGILAPVLNRFCALCSHYLVLLI